MNISAEDQLAEPFRASAITHGDMDIIKCSKCVKIWWSKLYEAQGKGTKTTRGIVSFGEVQRPCQPYDCLLTTDFFFFLSMSSRGCWRQARGDHKTRALCEIARATEREACVRWSWTSKTKGNSARLAIYNSVRVRTKLRISPSNPTNGTCSNDDEHEVHSSNVSRFEVNPSNDRRITPRQS